MSAIGSTVLDTSVAVAHLRGVATVTERMAEAEKLYLPLIALGELHYGILRSREVEKNLHGLRNWLQAVTLLSITEATCEQYGRIKDELARAGTPIPENDIWISAVAREHSLPIAVRDEHFKKVTGLVVLDWR